MRGRRGFLGTASLAVAVALVPGGAAGSEQRGVAEGQGETAGAAIRGVLDAGRHPWLGRPDLADVLPALRALYTEPVSPFWLERGRPAALESALVAIAGAERLGLASLDYDAGLLAEKRRVIGTEAAGVAETAAFDVAVSVSLMRLLLDAHRGRVDPRTVGFGHEAAARSLDLPSLLTAARERGDVSGAIDSVGPRFPLYGRLLTALGAYRRIARREPPVAPSIPRGRGAVRPGESWDGIPALTARLRTFGDLDATIGAATPDAAFAYAKPIVDAVRSFQMRHGLEEDGVIGPATIERLNVPAAGRVRQIELALERARWLSEIPHEPVVFVNVPLFGLWAHDPDRPQDTLAMKIVAGKALENQTPLFVDEIESVIFRPYWVPPMSILRDEILPRARKDAGYLARERMEIVASSGEAEPSLPATAGNLDRVARGRLVLRQRPGERNSLGLVKFVFPNSADVYMHGTPAQSLFVRARRDFSHGCIRVEFPDRLAEWALRDDPQWPRERIGAAMRGDRTIGVRLNRKLRVILFYDTVFTDSSGLVRFADDYYGHDARLERALARPR